MSRFRRDDVTREQDSQFKSTLSVKARNMAATERQRKVFGFSINVLIRTHPRIRGCRSEKWRAKGNHMALAAILQEESLTRLLQGAAAGAVCDLGHRLHLGRLGHRRNRKGEGAKRRQHGPRVGLVS